MNSFDMLFTHHVIEHVLDIEKVARDMRGFLKSSGKMLHVLPCANPGSFEYNISSLYVDGIDPSRGNRFFYEDPGHLRRMSTDDMDRLFGSVGFRLEREFYANQFWGTVYLFSDTTPSTIKEIFNPQRRNGRPGFIKFCRALFLALFYARYAARMNIRDKFTRKSGDPGLPAAKRYAIGLAGVVAYLPAVLLTRLLEFLARREWLRRANDRSGSEMALIFTRA